ncbi:MAG: adenylate/guanylate cyclase domain-containing protein [Deltaproteobacteria bacterium]|nr:adenylate/guanylate cyclase domain-containing protein [Deltaproteobacteria bacterium]
MKDDTDSLVSTEIRRLAAIMFTDIVGFSRQMGSNEARTLRLLDIHNQLIRQTVTAHHGVVVKTVGDAFLVEFPSVVHAVQCAQQIQAQFRTHNAEQPHDEQIHVRIGIHSGDIVQRDGDVFGDGVNIASRLQGLAEPDTICISDVVYRDVAKKLELGPVVSLGRPKLKNIAERFEVYALLSTPPKGFRGKLFRRVRFAHCLVAAGLLLVTATLGVVYYLVHPLSTQDSALRTNIASAALPLPDKPSIVVLPFTNMSDDSKPDYLGDGIVEDITTNLAKLSGLFVIARNSAFTYKGKSVKVQKVSRELGVRYVFEGSIRRAGDQVRVTAQLIDATSGYHLWSERYERPLRDIFALQDEIVHKIVVHLALRLTTVEQEQLERAYAVNLEAYELRARAFELPFQGKEGNAQARQLCEQAIELDPTYAQAYTCTGFTYVFEWGFQWTQDIQTLERAWEYGQKAIALDDSLPVAHELLGQIYFWKQHYEQAIAELERALALGPSWGSAYATLGSALNAVGRSEEAIDVLEKAIRLNPRSPIFTSNYLAALGNAYRLTGRNEEAITALKKSLSLRPNGGAALILAATYSDLGRDAEAQAMVTAGLKVNPYISVEGLRQRPLYRDPAVTERFLAALHKAGLK